MDGFTPSSRNIGTVSDQNRIQGIQAPRWISQVLIIGVTLAVVVLTIYLGSRTYSENRRMALDQFNRQQLILARSTASAVETYFREVGAVLFASMSTPCIREIRPECLKYMKKMYEGFLERTSIRRIDETGTLRYIYPTTGWRKDILGKNYKDRTFFRTARDTGIISVSDIVTNENGEQRIRMAQSVYHNGVEGQGSFAGIIVISFDLEDIAQAFITPIVSGKTGYAWLMNDHGRFLAHHEREFVGQDVFTTRAEKSPDISYESINQIQRTILEGNEGIGHYVSGWHRGRQGVIEKLIAYSPVNVFNQLWSVAVCAPVDEVDRIMRSAGLNALYSFGFIVFVLVSGGTFLSVSAYRWSHALEREVASRTKELAETSTYLHNLIRCANAPVFVLDPQKRINLSNEAFEKMSGRSEQEMIGKPFDMFLPDEHRTELMRMVDRVVKYGEEWNELEIPILRKNGELRTGLWNSANIYDEGEATIIATVAHGQDITDRRRLEGQLRHAQKMETMGTLVAGVAHEINNPINQIMFNIPLLQNVWQDMEPLLEHEAGVSPDRKYGGLTVEFLRENMDQILSDMDMAANRVIQTVANLKNFAQQSSISDKSPMKINTAVENALRLIKTTMRKAGIHLEVHLMESQPFIYGNLHSIEQIVMNITINALQSIDHDSGIITIVTGVEKRGRRVFIAISDNGTGIDSSVSEYLFDPFFTTKQADGGSGLGLSITYNLVEAHGGEISFHSHEGKGTTFMIFFPIIQIDEEMNT